MPLSIRRKITISAVTATLSAAIISIAYVHYKKRIKLSDTIDDFSDDHEDVITKNGRNSSSADSLSTPHTNVFNSSRLNIFNTSRLNHDSQPQDSMNQLHDLSATKHLPDGVRFISYKSLFDLIKNSKQSRNYIIFDLRTPAIDYNGGHIVDSVLLPDSRFYGQIPEIFSKYHAIESLIVQCMDGTVRSLQCIEYYSKARKQCIKYYDAETKLSYYYKYTLRIQHGAHKTVMRSIKFDNEQWMKKFVKKEKVMVDFNGREAMYANLMKQKLFVVAGGFFDFLNMSVSDGLIDLREGEIIKGFNNGNWEELTVMGERKMYHKTEYYTTRRSNPLRKTSTKREF